MEGQSDKIAELEEKINEVIEKNVLLKTTVLGEPQLGKRGLYPTLSSKNMSQSVTTMMNLISYCDGNTSLLEIADLINEPFWELVPLVKKLADNTLVSVKKSKGKR